MDRENHDNVIYFAGPEVEHTPHFSHRTLFVVGVRGLAQMVEYANENKCTHVYLGANQSFQKNKFWNNIITGLLAAGLRVTLDYPVEHHSFVIDILDKHIWHNSNFVPLLSCKIRGVEDICKNLTLKIDDVDFNVSNTGVWTKSINELLDPNRKTEWSEYTNDEILLRDTDVKKNAEKQTNSHVKQKTTESKRPKKKVTVKKTKTKRDKPALKEDKGDKDENTNTDTERETRSPD